jgi:predicted dehydrogenase/threonine dehydrogenase-like Zn-dependent dehydrogenase
MLIDFGKAGWIDKARQQPDKARMVFEKVGTDGLFATLESVQAKLDQPIPLGYSNAGVALEVGEGVSALKAGDRIASNGPHAEIVRVPANLCARIPDSVPDEHAAFTVISVIALEGLRLAQPTLGETFVVTGLGLIGLIAVQLLRAHGCRVLGIDFDPRKAELARHFGAETVVLSNGEDPVAAAERLTLGRGVDGVLITAATKSNEPVHHAALMCRKRGRIVLVGVTGLQLSRDDFYRKELSFQVSCSYGPGRYDSAYEEGGHDYPYGFVRWTAQRNLEAVLDMMANGRLDVAPLITHRFPFDRATEAYELMQTPAFYLGILLEYSSEPVLDRTVALKPLTSLPAAIGNTGFVGAGGYASKVLIPAFKRAGAGLVSVASSGGVSAAHAGHKFGFAEATTDVDALLRNPRIDTIVIATRHDTHAGLVCRALQAGKHVFVEKPLAITSEDIERIEFACASASPAPLLMVGFNRRFAPQIGRIKSLLAGVRAPKSIVITVNAGASPADHWTQDRAQSGGRVLGEGCHFIDLARFLAGSKIVGARVPHAQGICGDSLSFVLEFEDGSTAAIQYLASGHKSFPKERVEVFAAGCILQLDNFRRLRGWGWRGFRKMSLWRQDKGNAACVAAFVNALRIGGPSPIALHELLEVSRTTIEVDRLATRG